MKEVTLLNSHTLKNLKWTGMAMPFWVRIYVICFLSEIYWITTRNFISQWKTHRSSSRMESPFSSNKIPVLRVQPAWRHIPHKGLLAPGMLPVHLGRVSFHFWALKQWPPIIQALPTHKLWHALTPKFIGLAQPSFTGTGIPCPLMISATLLQFTCYFFPSKQANKTIRSNILSLYQRGYNYFLSPGSKVLFAQSRALFYDLPPHTIFSPGLTYPSYRLEKSGPVGFMGYGDLWGFNSIVLIFYKSRLGFMGIYITGSLSINPHKSFQYLYHSRSAHKSQPGFIKNQYYQIKSP